MTSMDDKNKHHYSLSNACEHDDAAETTRTGTLWTAVAYIITSVIGAGVLSLSWAVAQLGWIAGPVVMIIFALITLYSTFLLVPRSSFWASQKHFLQACRTSERKAWLCALVQYLLLYGICVAYTITTSVSVRAENLISCELHCRAISRSNCYHKNGHDSPCHFPDLTSMVIYGVMQVILCQIPNFHKLWGLSIVAAIMSFTYATLGIGLGLAKGTLGGISTTISLTRAQKVWKILPALGDIAFAFPFSPLVLEIQSPPAENRTMKKATMISIVITASFYMLCGLLGYAAFGENAPGNLLTGFGFYEPYWLIDFANACIVVHLVGAYQVTSQPIFNFIEGWISQKWADSVLISKTIGIRVPFLGFYHVNILRLVWRTAFVVSTTGIAILFPLFNDVVGILGALNFWPLVVYFPVEMYIVQKKVQRWTLSWNLLQTLSFVALLVTLVTAVGSIESLVKDKET
eukprot:PITA_01258